MNKVINQLRLETLLRHKRELADELSSLMIDNPELNKAYANLVNVYTELITKEAEIISKSWGEDNVSSLCSRLYNF